MGSKLSVGPALGGIGISNVALVATTTIEETGTIFDQVVEAAHSPCSPRQFWPAIAGGGVNNITLPTGLGQAPAGILIVPPRTNYAIAVSFRPVSGSVAIRIHKNAPFLLYFDQASLPASFDLIWGGQNWSDELCTATSANPCVFTRSGGAHAMVANEAVRLTSGTPPTGFSLDVPYYVRNPSGSNFELAATPNGTSIASTSTGTTPRFSTDNQFLLLWL